MAGPPDAAELLDRSARGERLTSREWGIVGAARKRAKAGNLPPPRPTPPPPGPTIATAARPGPKTGPPTAAQILAEDSAPARDDVGADDDAQLARDVTKGFLAGIDQGLQQYTTDLAQKCGADRTAIADYRKAVALPPIPSAALAEVSPTIIRRLNITAGQYAMGAGLAGLAPWAFMVARTLQELSTLAKARAAQMRIQPPAASP